MCCDNWEWYQWSLDLGLDQIPSRVPTFLVQVWFLDRRTAPTWVTNVWIHDLRITNKTFHGCVTSYIPTTDWALTEPSETERHWGHSPDQRTDRHKPPFLFNLIYPPPPFPSGFPLVFILNGIFLCSIISEYILYGYLIAIGHYWYLLINIY